MVFHYYCGRGLFWVVFGVSVFKSALSLQQAVYQEAEKGKEGHEGKVCASSNFERAER